MTIKFFPLFFIDEEQGYGFSPIQLSVVYLLSPLVTAFLALLCRKLAEKISQPIILLCVVKFVGTGLLFVLALGDRARQRPFVMAGVFVARTGLMNCPAGIKRAVLMDAVEKKSRAKWNSLESITRFTWSGSAALGGVMVTKYGYRFCFLVTSIVYVFSTAPMLLLIRLVPPKKANSA